MTERMTPERLAEIDNYVATLIEDNILEIDDALPELLQALKAERDRIEELGEKFERLQSAHKFAVKHAEDNQSRIEAGLKLADEMEGRNYSGTMDWYAEQLREVLGDGRDESV